MSANVLNAMVALVVFRASSFYLGVVVVGLCGGLEFAQIRRREWQKVAFNSSLDCITCIVAALVFWGIAGNSGTPVAVLIGAAALAGVADLLVNSSVLSLPISITSGQSYRSTVFQVTKFHVSAYPYVFLGLGVGLTYLGLGLFIIPMIIVPVVIARQAFASYLELKAAQENTIETLIRALEAKDKYTAGHAQRVATFSAYIAEEFAFGPSRSERLRYAALMHDIGKLVVPNQLLNKPGRLTEAEFGRVRLHETVSVELLRRIDFLAPVAGDTTTEAATAAVDGSVLVEPAIIHVADAFDAMTSTRSYRKALSQETAFEELRKGSGTQFNSACVDALIGAILRRGEAYGAGHEVDDHEWAVAPPEAGTGSAGLGHLVPEEQGAKP